MLNDAQIRLNKLWFEGRINDLVERKLVSRDDAIYLSPKRSVKKADHSGIGPNLPFSPSFFIKDNLNTIRRGAKNGDPRMMYRLATYYLSQKGGCSDGLRWLMKADASNLIKASVKIGVLYENGLCGYELSIKEAINHYLIGLVALEPESIYRLSVLSRKGLYKAKLNATAKELNESSAVLGLPISQYLKGAQFFGNDKSYEESDYAWLLIAYSQGVDFALDALIKIKREKNADLTDEGRRILKEFGSYRYSQFGYTDFLGGYEYRTKRINDIVEDMKNL